MLKPGAVIEFNRIKYFKHIRPLGRGGTGETRLFKDETTDTFFAIKKYSPNKHNDIAENYDRFVQEIKILFDISHQNIARIYNHYLYPDKKTGFIQMEYINGCNIDAFIPCIEKTWNDIFIETLRAFQYLEEKNILHRDIRPSNILIDDNRSVKIIDFGFGKKLSDSLDAAGSIMLNWPVSEHPLEVTNERLYTQQSEIFFLGKLFSYLDLDSEFMSFRFHHIIQKMTELDPKWRYRTFAEVLEGVNQLEFFERGFDDVDKIIYQEFTTQFLDIINSFTEPLKMERDTNEILQTLKSIITVNIFEDNIQNSKDIIRCFLKNSSKCYANRLMDTEVLKSFYNFMSRLPSSQQQIVWDNFHNKLTAMIRVIPEVSMDDVPF